MTENTNKFDLFAFYCALEATVISREVNWKQVAEQTGVSASTLTRMGQGRAPDSEGLAKLAKWAQLNPGDFVPGDAGRAAAPLAQISALLSADPNLNAEGVAALDAVIKSTYTGLLKQSRKATPKNK